MTEEEEQRRRYELCLETKRCHSVVRENWTTYCPYCDPRIIEEKRKEALS